MRLFLAINLPEEIKAVLAKELLRFKYLKFREIEKENWHVTLKFIGDMYDDHDVSLINECISTIISQTPPFDLTISDVGFLNPRIFSFNIARSAKLYGLFRIIDERLASCKITRLEERKFHAHITVGRKHPSVEREFHSVRHFDFKQREAVFFPVSSIDLMESRLTDKGALYRVVEEYRFKS